MACSGESNSNAETAQAPGNTLMQVISGEVWYRERIALPPGAEVIVTLEDQSRTDAPATTLTDYIHVVADLQQPFSFHLVYDPSTIEEPNLHSLMLVQTT